MGNLNVNIAPEDIEKAIVQAVIDSALGVKINEAIKKAMDELGSNSYWNRSPITTAIEQQIRGIALDTVQRLYRPMIEEVVSKRMTAELVDQLLTKVLDAFLSRN